METPLYIEAIRVRVHREEDVICYGRLFQKQMHIWVKFDDGVDVDTMVIDPSIKSIELINPERSLKSPRLFPPIESVDV